MLNSLMAITRAGGSIGIPGLYVTEDPGSKDEAAQQGQPSNATRSRMGEESQLLHWADACAPLQPAAHASDLARPSSHSEDRQRDRGVVGQRAARLPGF